ncbi:MAG: S8 family serine peptidase [Halococcoides sp.]
MTRSLAIAFVALMVCSVGVAPVVATTSPDRSKTDTARIDLAWTHPPDRTPADGGSSPAVIDQPAPIDDAIERSGTVELIVRFDDADLSVSSRSATARLQSHASATQAAFDRFAAARDGVTIVRDFWLANAKLVRVDTDRVSLDALARVDHVAQLHENVRVSVGSAKATAGPTDPAPGSRTLSADLGSRTLSADLGSRTPTADSVVAPIRTPSSGTSAVGQTLSNGEQGTYGLDMINASEAWQTYDQRGENATVAVLDTGINTSAHPELAPHAWAEFDADGSREGTSPNDGHGHGTHVSGTVVGNTTDTGLHYGVAPNATLLHGKVMNDEGSGTFAAIVAGMEWAVTHPADTDVISMSLGNRDSRFIEPIRNAREAGVVVVAATGNTGVGTADDPAAVYEALAVGAVNASGGVASFSSGTTIDTSARYGLYAPDRWPDSYVVPDVVAPGVDVYSADATGGYKYLSGTSMATPHVAGVAALIRSEHPNITEAGVRERLSATADHPDGDVVDDRYGEGIVNATAALEHRDATVTGTITVNGSAAENVTVRAGSGYTTTTNVSGGYELAVPSGTLNVSIDPFGWSETVSTTSVDAGTTATVNLSTADRVVEVELVDPAAHYRRPAENVTVTYRTAHVETFNASAKVNLEASTHNATLYVEGTPRNSGENVTLSGGPDERINVTVDPEPAYVGTIALEHNFHNGTHHRTVTGPTRIHPDPVVYPRHVNETDLQTLTSYVEPYTTVEINRSSPLVRNASAITLGYDSDGDPITTGYLVTNPITLRMTAGSAPIEFQNTTSHTTIGIYLAGGIQNATLADLSIDGGGVHTAIASAQAQAAIRNSTIDNASVGIEQSASLPADAVSDNSITVSDVAILVGGSVTSVDGNRIGTTTTGPETGIRVIGGSVQSITGNHIEANTTGIQLPMGSPASVDEIGSNTIDGYSSTGITVAGGDVGTIRDNDLTGGFAGIDAAHADRITNNTVANTSYYGIHPAADGVVVRSNTIVNSPRGLVVRSANDSSIDGTAVENASRAITIEQAHNVTIANVSVDRTTETGLRIVDARGVSVQSPVLDSAGLAIESGSNVSVSNLTVRNASHGIAVGQATRGPSTNVSIETATIENTTQEITLRNGTAATVANVSIARPTQSNATVVFGAVDPAAVAVRNLTLANGTSLSTSGHNATLDEGVDPGDQPANLTAVGPYLALDAAGSNPTLDVSIPYNGSTLTDVETATLAMYRYDGSQWSTAGSNSVEGTTLNTTDIASFSTFGVFAEPTTPNFTVSNLSAPASAVQSETITVNATITNDGSDQGTQTIEYVLDGTTRNSTTVSLDAGNATTVGLDWTVPDDFATGDYDHGIHSANDSQTATLSVEEETGWIAGTVIANHTASGIDSATITVSLNGSTYSTTANATGKYNLTIPTDTNYTVTATHPDYESNQTGSVAVSRDATTTVDLTLDPDPGRIEGAITDNVTDDAVTNATVTVEDAGTTVNTTTSDGSGYGLDVPAGTYDVIVGHPNFTNTTQSSVTVGANETVTLDAALDPLPGAIDWAVTSNRTGVALANTTVTLSNGTTVNQSTAGNGTFDPVERATGYTLEFANADYETATRTVDVGPNETVVIDQTLDPLDGTVNGTITDANGSALPRATVTIDGTALTATTDANGSYTIASVPTERSMTINATARAYGRNTTTVTLSANGTETATLSLTQRDHYFGIDSLAAGDITAGETVTATALVANLGASNWTSPVELRVDGSTRTTTNVSLNASANASVDLSTTISSAGDYDITVASANETVTTTITVESAGGGISLGSGFEIDEETTTESSGTVVTPVEATTTTTETPTATTTETATATTPTTTTDRPTTTKGPGFGSAIALIAVLAGAALLCRRP